MPILFITPISPDISEHTKQAHDQTLGKRPRIKKSSPKASKETHVPQFVGYQRRSEAYEKVTYQNGQKQPKKIKNGE